ncbi:hypothetical protein HTZ84_09620 [Haloterrigena sp. SYSU A558-1]|uniref:Uncharacterized protein n=1 Tax=Haloterrigena gelatinilytica TaxID=2741724 RepID=A0ABX2L8H2_9EURY|nr:hypothetical protein [Haloterrigena gelatinilytica]NUC72564.1 hypothetical protein [Haloterrigena gelatinilytica]
MFTDNDPDHTEPNAYDDRDDNSPEFEVEDELAFGIGFDLPDPADDPLPF